MDSSSAVDPYKPYKCECEHSRHFLLAIRDDSAHKYGARVPAVMTTNTKIYGVLMICRDCREKCYPRVTKKEKS